MTGQALWETQGQAGAGLTDLARRGLPRRILESREDGASDTPKGSRAEQGAGARAPRGFEPATQEVCRDLFRVFCAVGVGTETDAEKIWEQRVDSVS